MAIYGNNIKNCYKKNENNETTKKKKEYKLKNIHKIKKLIFKNKYKKETKDEIKDRIFKICNTNKDYGIFPPPMNSTDAIIELCNHLLGEGWYTSMPVSQEQINTIIVYEIETRYKRIK